MPRWTPPVERFWSKVKKGKGCWEWQGCCSDTGYGNFYAFGALHLTHRLSWSLHHGAIPKGLCVLHKCDNRRCVNPGHLFLGTKKQNSTDMAAKGRERVPCLRGEMHGAAKLTNKDVVRLRMEVAAGRTRRSLAKELGVSESLVGLVVRRKAWRHI